MNIMTALVTLMLSKGRSFLWRPASSLSPMITMPCKLVHRRRRKRTRIKRVATSHRIAAACTIRRRPSNFYRCWTRFKNRRAGVTILKSGELENDMVLARDLVTKDGILLLSNGYILDEKIIKKIQVFERLIGAVREVHICVK